MARVKRGVTSRAKHKKVLKAVKGQWGRRKNTIRVAKQAMEKAMQYAYRDRRNKKRDFKSLWIQRINMARVKRGVTSRAKHKKVLKAVKGQWGRRKNTIRVARQAMEKAMQYAYRDRRNKKRDFKSIWIQRINAGVRSEGLTYSKFIFGLNKCGIKIDRKILAEIAYDSPEAFKTIVQKAQSALN